ncbi:MAG: SLC26A/SulP transporter family protein [Bacillota bacterium]
MNDEQRGSGSSLAGDFWGGLAAMLVALPSAIAFGVLVYTAIAPGYAGLGALAGILGAAALGIISALVGRNGGFITAPSAPAAAVMSALAASLAAAGIEGGHVVVLLAIAALLSAALQGVYGALRAGRLIKFIPYQVVSGYLSGVGLVIALGQLPKLLGLPKSTSLLTGLSSPRLWNAYGIAVGVATIVVTVAAPRLTRKIPAPILGLLGGVVVYFVLALYNPVLLQLSDNHLIIGPIQTPGTLVATLVERANAITAVRFSDISLILVSALMLSVLLSIDTLKTGVVLDALTRGRHNSNRELIGQGAANAVSALVGGMPGSGTMGATLVNVTSGGRTPRSGFLEGLFVALAFLVLGRLIAWIPIGALAGLLLVVAFRMFDFSMFRLLRNRLTRVDFIVIATVVAVAQIDLILASLTGVCLAILLFIRDQIRGSVIENKVDLRGVHSKRRRLMAEREILTQHGDEALFVRLRGNLFFGTTDQLYSELEPDMGKRRYVLMDLRHIQSMDYTAIHLLEQMRDRLHEQHGELLFSGMPSNLPMRKDIQDYMAELGLARGSPGVRIFDTRDGAIEWIEDRVLESAGWAPKAEERALALGEIEVFRKLEPATLQVLAGVVRELSFPAGGRICTYRERGDEIFFVRRGRAGALLPLEGGQRHHLATFCQGDFFGEMTFLDREPRTADVEAFTPTDLYALSRERFDALAKSNAALGSLVFEQLAHAVSKRLRDADTELRMLEGR